MKRAHGIFRNCVDKDNLKEVSQSIKEYIVTNQINRNYINNICDKVKGLTSLVNKELTKDISNLLEIKSPELCSVELHIQHSKSPPIPAHQDNFYHCIESRKGLKILIPLQELNSRNGGLSFLDTGLDQKILNHIASNHPGFSSIIPEDKVSLLKYASSSYSYLLGDCSYHFLNAIHYSQGNQTDEDTFFLVYRYHAPDAVINEKMRSKYEIVFKQHQDNVIL